MFTKKGEVFLCFDLVRNLSLLVSAALGIRETSTCYPSDASFHCPQHQQQDDLNQFCDRQYAGAQKQPHLSAHCTCIDKRASTGQCCKSDIDGILLKRNTTYTRMCVGAWFSIKA
ncbi:hypothetical protein PoB_000453000 [Plakobranchus ocellatus]|uniref:Domain of unknown function DB domain-containing protein n=1 Tax=Plakobranchus ocellatus TaxID=259542 RepID=A0AAV3Y6B4_9GAST|nr:hypothetical protein PoB_000453000 [Plakobranchus ocellatus]